MIILNAVLGLLGTGLLCLARRGLSGTTMLASWRWAVLSVIAVSVTEACLLATGGDATIGEPIRYLAATTTFCPMVAVLGAKRPQHRAWQLIVISLWAVLALPAAEALAFHAGSRLDIRDARGAFLWILVLVGLANALPTRFAVPAIVCAVAQATLLSAHLPFLNLSTGPATASIGLALMVTALALSFMKAAQRYDRATAENRVWLDFRDMFGAVWGLRVQQRINDIANLQDWNVRLGWGGLTGISREPVEIISDDDRNALNRAFRTVLRRFVSREWIDKRLKESPRQ